MSAPAAEVIRRGNRLARLRAAGIPDPVLYIRTEQQTRDALKDWRQPATAAVAVPPPRLAQLCPWCGTSVEERWTACKDCRDLEEALSLYQAGEDL